MPKLNQLNLPKQVGFDPRAKLWLSIIGVVAISAILVALVTDHLYNPNNYNISKITLSGNASHVDREALKASVIELIDGNYFSLDTSKLLASLYALPWVASARLRRNWPDTLLIHIDEHQPIALWGESRWLTTNGKLVSLPLPKNVILPKLSGPSDEVDLVWPKYQAWSAKFAKHGMQLTSMNLNSQHLYTLKLAYSIVQEGSGKEFEMILLESNADQQIDAFLTSYQQTLIGDTRLIKTVDLRYSNGFSIRRYEPDKLAQVTQ